MYRLTRCAFAIADLFAWLLVVFSVVSALVFPFVLPAYAGMSGQQVSVLGVAIMCASSLAIAFGAYYVTRRKVFGLFLLLLPALYLYGLAAAFGFLLLFVTPFAMAFLEARSSSAGPVA